VADVSMVLHHAHGMCVYDDIRSVCNHADEQCHNGDLSVSVSDALLPLDPTARLPPAKRANSVIVCWHRRTKRQHTTTERGAVTGIIVVMALSLQNTERLGLLVVLMLSLHLYHLQTAVFSSNGL